MKKSALVCGERSSREVDGVQIVPRRAFVERVWGGDVVCGNRSEVERACDVSAAGLVCLRRCSVVRHDLVPRLCVCFRS